MKAELEKNQTWASEKGKNWCEQVGCWTDDMLSSDLAEEATADVNWAIRALAPNQPQRLNYDALIGLLKEGYRLAAMRAAGLGREVRFPVLGETGELPPVALDEHAERARDRIEEELSDPLMQWTPRMFQHGFDPAWDPFTRRILHMLGEAQRCLQMLLTIALAKHLSPQERGPFMSSPVPLVSGLSTWDGQYQALEAELKRGMARRAPWMWLGVNLLGFGAPQRTDVFEAIKPNLQLGAGIVVSSACIGPVPDFVSTIRDSLQVVIESLSETAGGGVPEEDRTFRTGPKEILVGIDEICDIAKLDRHSVETYNWKAKNNTEHPWNHVVVFDELSGKPKYRRSGDDMRAIFDEYRRPNQHASW